MQTRRDLIRTLGLIGAGAAATPLLASCGDSSAPGPHGGTIQKASYAVSHKARSAGSQTDAVAVTAAVSAFTSDLYTGLSKTTTGNLVCSPYSVAVALAMTLNGARGRTATEMDHVLHTDDVHRLDSGMSWLSQALESRSGTKRRQDSSHGTVALDTANSLWGERDTPWQQPFLDALAEDYGAGMRLVDYKHEAAAARTQINDWTAAHTHDKIPQIIPAGVLDAATRLVLVNAIWFKAPWEEPFQKTATAKAAFTRGDGSKVQADLMEHSLTESAYAAGAGWQAARLGYVGGELAMTVVVPTGDLSAVESALAGDGLAHLLAALQPAPVDVFLPRWTFRTGAELTKPLSDLGMPTAFTAAADFSGMTLKDQLRIKAVLHQAYIAVDEDGTEAAAATASVMRSTARTGGAPVSVRADRAFLFVLHDVETRTPLFIGRVDDPTA